MFDSHLDPGIPRQRRNYSAELKRGAVVIMIQPGIAMAQIVAN